MIHPSYSELMQKVNNGAEFGEEPVVNSRYSIVIATAKRARQIIAGAEPFVENSTGKPLSIAVDELYSGDVKILGEEDDADTIAEEVAEEVFVEDAAEEVVAAEVEEETESVEE
ncbi:MAG: DNA-directed RNA polymerase subunit omega [Eubacterium sp.]|nr:DNA-directed RNA polymerase subunit omega [Eubacterium sp.]